MKKTILICLCLMLLLCAFACKSADTSAAAQTAQAPVFTTLGDVYAIEEDGAYSMDDSWYLYVFDCNGTTYRVAARVTPELYAKTEEIDFFDEEREQKIHALLADLPIVDVTNLSANIPSQAELESYKGKTGAELVDLGFSYIGYNFSDEQTVYYMERGDYSYDVTFNEVLSFENDEIPDDFDADAALMPLTVKSVTYAGVGGSYLDYIPQV